jgi:predicted TIM-barrel fold metal-dependent hydrolase
LHAAVLAHPDRFAAFAALPTPDPIAAAAELDRCVEKLGFKGAMIHGLTNQEFLDHKKYWPIFERAQALDVPIYLHPSAPHPAVMEVYYQDYLEEFPMVIRAAWGFTVETATMAIRLILSGIFEEYPRLKIVLGHMGETLPFLLWRINQALSRPGNKKLSFRDTFCEHFHITTSGNFSNPALLCSMMEIGIDRIMFAIDWPFVANPPGIDWINGAPICAEDRAKILSGNVQKLLKM